MKKKYTIVIVALTLCLSLSSIFTSNKADAATDVTTSYSKILAENALDMAYYAYRERELSSTYPIATGQYFASKVKTGGPWDYKRKYTGSYIYRGNNVKGEDLGNIHYGYVGSAAGFSVTTLKSAAGAYQIKSSTAKVKWYSTYFDDPNDQKWISYGITMWQYGTLPDYSSALRTSKIATTDSITMPNIKTPDGNYDFSKLSDEKKKEIDEQVKKDVQEIQAEQE
ncbi:polymorphic toxin type 44 domain-containing protein [Priestia endophytica]|uniref:polymorphic toxin type 44 domain-containing protein n=1 Tax=Priestia endophytica TaxID=135735 RepID=UPI003D2D8CEB